MELAPSVGRTETDVASYIPFNGFTTVELGAARSAVAYGVICRQDGTSSRMLLNTFEQAWTSGDLDDVTDAVVDNISQMYRENPPELVYYAALYRIFHEFGQHLADVSREPARARVLRCALPYLP